jgi:hypothetical protein
MMIPYLFIMIGPLFIAATPLKASEWSFKECQVRCTSQSCTNESIRIDCKNKCNNHLIRSCLSPQITSQAPNKESKKPRVSYKSPNQSLPKVTKQGKVLLEKSDAHSASISVKNNSPQQEIKTLIHENKKIDQLFEQFTRILKQTPPIANMTFSLEDMSSPSHSPTKSFTLWAQRDNTLQYYLKMQIDVDKNTAYLEKIDAIGNAQGGSKAIISVFHHLLDKVNLDEAWLVVMPEEHSNASYVARLYWELGYDFDERDRDTLRILNRITTLMTTKPTCSKNLEPHHTREKATLEYLKDSNILNAKIYLNLPPKKGAETGPKMIRKKGVPSRSLEQAHGIKRGEKACWQS